MSLQHQKIFYKFLAFHRMGAFCFFFAKKKEKDIQTTLKTKNNHLLTSLHVTPTENGIRYCSIKSL